VPAIQHPAFPVTLQGGRLATVTQGAPREIAQCVQALLRTPRGWRGDFPPYGDTGLDPQEFRMAGADLAEIDRQITTYEPRADSLIDEDPDALNDALSLVGVQLSSR
jgi:phage baseplate assembly protein W